MFTIANDCITENPQEWVFNHHWEVSKVIITKVIDFKSPKFDNDWGQAQFLTGSKGYILFHAIAFMKFMFHAFFMPI